ncbi:MAG: hypothetical protein IPJ13_01990 [Saprospiraceae bacterium]|nr:hypothetical protein [Saprospiraceae bacterium]
MTIKLRFYSGYPIHQSQKKQQSTISQRSFEGVFSHFADITKEQLNDPAWLKENKPYTGELLLGHLRYGTHGANTHETVHPFLRQNNWITRNLVLAGNFNLTNVDELFAELLAWSISKEKIRYSYGGS